MIDEKRFKLVDTKTGKEYEFDGIKGSIGPDVINISSLYKKTGLFTYDPGFTSTAACNSKITYICLLYTSPSPRDLSTSRMPSSA